MNIPASIDKIKSLGDVGYDEDNWGVGVSGVVDDPSPFPRINRLRDWFLDGRVGRSDTISDGKAGYQGDKEHDRKGHQKTGLAFLEHTYASIEIGFLYLQRLSTRRVPIIQPRPADTNVLYYRELRL